VDTENISNNRFTIWQAYLELYKEKPVFGFSTRSALPYVTENYPDSYLAKTQYVTHNTYLSLLVETGILGFLVMAVFLLFLFIRFVRKVRSHSPLDDTCRLFAAWIVIILVFGLCFHDIFFTMNFETMLFLSGLGFVWKSC
jgi:O-antigen ligase